MLTKFRAELRRPSPSFVLSLIALFVALGGTGAYAIDKVSSSEIANGGVKTADLHKNAVTGKKVKTESLDGSDLDFEPIAATNLGTIPPNGVREVTATCQDGMLATGGGWDLGTPGPPPSAVSERSSGPDPGQNGGSSNAWTVLISNSANVEATVAAVAVCVPD
jgi:hypothetical protein